MEQEDKELLLKDLCARLPYGVKCKYFDCCEGDYDEGTICGFERQEYIQIDGVCIYIEDVKPYLFPLSSMTEEQRIELYKVLGWGYESHYHLSKEWEDFNESIDNNGLFLPASWVSELNKMYNWLNKNHFDYRGLIPMGLANDATGLNIY